MNESYIESVQRRALVLLQGCSPYQNMVPTMELIKEADQLGYTLVRKSLAQCQEDGLHAGHT